MTDYFDYRLFIDTVSFAKVEQAVKMFMFSTRIHFKAENRAESLHFFIFCSGVVQFWRCHLVLRLLDHTQLDTHTHTHTHGRTPLDE